MVGVTWLGCRRWRQYAMAWAVVAVLVVQVAGCGGSDDDSDATATPDTSTSPTDDSTTTSGETSSQAEPPECFADHLAGSPVVGVEDHQRLVEGISVEVLIVEHSEEAIALELEDADEVIGVMRVSEGDLVDYEVVVYDLVDATCARVPATPQRTADEIANTAQTVVPIELEGRSYEVVFDQGRRPDPIATTTFRRT
jgi:hypothetical protein